MGTLEYNFLFDYHAKEYDSNFMSLMRRINCDVLIIFHLAESS